MIFFHLQITRQRQAGDGKLPSDVSALKDAKEESHKCSLKTPLNRKTAPTQPLPQKGLRRGNPLPLAPRKRLAAGRAATVQHQGVVSFTISYSNTSYTCLEYWQWNHCLDSNSHLHLAQPGSSLISSLPATCSFLLTAQPSLCL